MLHVVSFLQHRVTQSRGTCPLPSLCTPAPCLPEGNPTHARSCQARYTLPSSQSTVEVRGPWAMACQAHSCLQDIGPQAMTTCASCCQLTSSLQHCWTGGTFRHLVSTPQSCIPSQEQCTTQEPQSHIPSQQQCTAQEPIGQ